MKKSKSVSTKSAKKSKSTTSTSPLLAILIIAGLATLVISYSYFNVGPKPSPEVAQKVGINEVVPALSGFATLRVVPAGVTGSYASPYKLDLQYDTTMNIIIDGGTNKLTGTTVEMTYDPTKLEIKSVTKGTYFPVVLSEAVINKTAKKVTFGYAISAANIDALPADGGPKTGSGILASFVVKPLVPGTTSVSFGSLEGITAPTAAQKALNAANTTKVIAKGYSDNVLTSAPDFTFTTNAKLSADFVETGDVQTIDAATGVQTADDQVNIFDYNFFVGAFGKVTAADLVADIALPANKKVDILDYAEFIKQWGF